MWDKRQEGIESTFEGEAIRITLNIKRITCLTNTKKNVCFLIYFYFVCPLIGFRFAQLEMKLCLISILSRFKLSTCDKTEIPIVMKKSGVMTEPQNPVWLSIEEI